jgi:hypothetical protein
MSVIDAKLLATAPAQNYGDLLRAVPGVNVSQMSARDINVTSRGATSSLSTGQLALVDGRSIYQDFFGFVAWDFLPINFGEVKQIEVIRGPASAIWGANALYGVVNVITKTPREMQGASFSMGVGTFNRDTKDATMDNGPVLHQRVLGRRAERKWSYRSRPAPSRWTRWRVRTARSTTASTPVSPYENKDDAAKFDVRVDYDGESNQQFVIAGGAAAPTASCRAGSDRSTSRAAACLATSRRISKGRAEGPILHEHARRQRHEPAGGWHRRRAHRVHLQEQHRRLRVRQRAGGRHEERISYGGNIRHNGFRLSIAPGEDARNEGGCVRRTRCLCTKFAVLGARVDWFDVLDGAVVRPASRLSSTAARPEHPALRTARVSRAVDDQQLPRRHDRPADRPGANSPRLAGNTTSRWRPRRNSSLTEVALDAYELGYTGGIKERRP